MSHVISRIDFTAGRERVARRREYEAAAVEIREALYSAEETIETSLLKMGRLQEAIIERRRAVGLASTVGHDLVLQTAAASGRLVEALNATIQLHGAAQAQSKRLGVCMDVGSHKEDDTIWGSPGG